MDHVSGWPWLVAAAACWGATNPLLRIGSQGVESVKRDGHVSQFLAELRFLITRWQYILPFCINQLGSVIFFIALGRTELSLAVPLCNSLTFVFSIFVGRCLGEPPKDLTTFIGLACIVLGSCLCVVATTDFASATEESSTHVPLEGIGAV